MSIEDRLQAVKLAEIDCDRHASNARNSWQKLKSGFREAATPWRIVTVGAISGFFMGRSGGGNNGGGVGAKIFGSAAQALIATLGASATAGMAAGAAADAAATATTDAVVDGSASPEARIAAARADGLATASGRATETFPPAL